MIIRRKNEMLQYNNQGWDATFHFNFQGLYNQDDEIFWGVSNLIVLNDDKTAGDFKWPAHHHENAEVITYLIKGQLQHKDSEGHTHVMNPGDFQLMSTGSGIFHSEEPFNSDVHLIQMWYVPNELDVKPSYRFIGRESYKEDGSWIIDDNLNTDAKLGIKKIENSFEVEVNDMVQYIYMIEGNLSINKNQINPGDAIVASNEKLSFEGEGKILIIEMPNDDQKRFEWFRSMLEKQRD